MSRRTSRFVPFLIALTVCASSAVVLGFAAWYLFGKNPATASGQPATVISDSARQMSSAKNAREGENPANGSSAPADASKLSAPAGSLPVEGGLIELGGEDSGIPARKVSVDSFFVAETEVTNHQYQEFVKEANYKAPAGWKDAEFPHGAANEPVTGVSWQSAVDYCNWLSSKLGMTVRLPSEAEWEMAARGPNGSKYPWGNEWDERAAASEHTYGFVHSVKSYPAGRSPSGAYDMAGNVWEWVADTPDGEGSEDKRVIKGGAANEQQALISARSRNIIPKDYSGAFLGFRFVIVKK